AHADPEADAQAAARPVRRHAPADPDTDADADAETHAQADPEAHAETDTGSATCGYRHELLGLRRGLQRVRFDR
ncbi:MAG: hypothetical protein ACJ77C_07110, partial [Chloroflexota bacterium]